MTQNVNEVNLVQDHQEANLEVAQVEAIVVAVEAVDQVQAAALPANKEEEEKEMDQRSLIVKTETM